MQRLTPLDSAFLRAETAGGHMHVGWVSALGPVAGGGALDVDLLRQRVAGRLHLAPRFRQVVVSTPVGEPFWVDDPRFDIGRHLRAVGQHSRLGREEVREVADRFLSAPLDRGKPLWELLVMPRVEGGRAAILGKVHHAMVDRSATKELEAAPV